MLCIDVLERLQTKPLRMFSDKKLREYHALFEKETYSHFNCACEVCIWFEKIVFEKNRREAIRGRACCRE